MPDGTSKSDLYDLLSDLRGDLKAVQEALSDQEPESLLTRSEAADRLRISTRTLDDMADAGEIQPVRIRGRVLYAPETLQAYIRRRAGEGR
ncbi:excisionase family DNA binding protein [Salinibacter ruber]|uniref:helix-turn-helix domain-containing protein n=1 Tax=Salinibacter ruber TaxID=146919 RepID=UPI0021693693|nr:helix-turn-helix domain-containing protein [Salinibacter ruber]MCS3955563.1 excisionase family DNA binding protein [Salinibacter ruber]